MKQIAGELPQWQVVAKQLNMGHEEIEDIVKNHKTAEEQRITFLSKWIARDGKAATYKKLSEVLVELKEPGAAEKIQEIALQHKWKKR